MLLIAIVVMLRVQEGGSSMELVVVLMQGHRSGIVLRILGIEVLLLMLLLWLLLLVLMVVLV